MSPIIIVFGVFFVLLFLGVPIAVSIGLACIAAIVTSDMSIPMVVIPQRMFAAANSFTLLGIPLYMMVGAIMEKSGITERLVNFAKALVGWMKYAMCYVAVITGMLMGGISGSCSADTAALSSVLTPTMKKMGYKEGFTAALMASCGTIGIIIPPSIPMIIMASVSGVSVGKLFAGGIIPGIIVGIVFAITCRILCARQKMALDQIQAFSMKILWKATKDAALALLAPIIILGGVLGGVFTATESGCVAAVYTLIIGLFVYKTIKPSMIKDILVDAARSTGTIMLVVAISFAMSWLLTRFNFHTTLSGMINSKTSSANFVMLVINIFYFIGGMFIDNGALIILLTPVMMPIATAAGVNPVLFAILISVNIAIGSITPPVGSALYVSAIAGKVRLEIVSKSMIPFILAMVMVLVILYVLPDLMLFIPNMILK